MATSCRLLDLPAELRNLIYEYALTSNNGKLFVRDPEPLQDIPEDMRVDYEEELDTYYKAPYSHGIKLCITTELDSEMNQLKYVCKQLHQETKRLTIGLNEIVFLEDDQCPVEPAEQFVRFIRQCSQPYLSKAKTVILKSESPEGSLNPDRQLAPTAAASSKSPYGYSALNLIADFCVANPTVTVHHYNKDIFQTAIWGEFWLQILVAHLATRRPIPAGLYGDKHAPFYVRTLPRVVQIFEEHRVYLNECPNFRTFPHDDIFDAKNFRRRGRRDAVMKRDTLPYVDGGMKTCVAEVERIFREGF
ncbi:hypothetical protein NX059_003559 [Plenodomus lindquistii]|nr:hypothetical protein NX059_003559 [Plenodomus lindquistii]